MDQGLKTLLAKTDDEDLKAALLYIKRKKQREEKKNLNSEVKKYRIDPLVRLQQRYELYKNNELYIYNFRRRIMLIADFILQGHEPGWARALVKMKYEGNY